MAFIANADKIVTVLGHPGDTLPFRGLEGFNVYDPPSGRWTLVNHLAWLKQAVGRGDDILLVSNPLWGIHTNEMMLQLSLLTSVGVKTGG